MQSKRSGAIFSAVGLLCIASAASASVVMYEENFEGVSTSLQNYKSFTTASTWTIVDGKYENAIAAPGNGKTQFTGALTSVNGLEAPQDWRVEAVASITSINTGTGVARLGLVGKAKNTNVGDWHNDALYYAGEFIITGANAGDLRIVYGRGGNTVGTYVAAGVVSIDGDIELDTEYTLALAGSYDSEGNLTLSFSVNDVVAVSDPIPAAQAYGGKYFGIRDYSDNTRAVTVTWDDLKVIAVPEPASAALLGLSSAAMLVRRRRSA